MLTEHDPAETSSTRPGPLPTLPEPPRTLAEVGPPDELTCRHLLALLAVGVGPDAGAAWAWCGAPSLLHHSHHPCFTTSCHVDDRKSPADAPRALRDVEAASQRPDVRGLSPDFEEIDLPEIQWDKNEYTGLQRSARSHEGTEYQVVAYEGYQGGGPAFLGAEEGAPTAARFLVDLVNRGLRLVPRQPTSSTFPVVAVMLFPSSGGMRQVHTVHAVDSAQAGALIADLVAQIEDGTFVPQEGEGAK